MSDAREQFQKDEELRKQLIAVTNADWFRKSLAFTKAEFLDTAGLNADMIQGARLFELTLLTLPVIESRDTEPVNSGLSHTPPELPSRKSKTKEKTK